MRDARISQDPREQAFQKANALAHELAPKNRAARQEANAQEYAKAYGEAYGEAYPSPPAADYGIVGNTPDRPARPSLRDRVAKQMCHAQHEARNLEQLEELRYLLDRNPDVARILDLVEMVRG